MTISQLPVCTSETEAFGQPARLPLWSVAVFLSRPHTFLWRLTPVPFKEWLIGNTLSIAFSGRGGASSHQRPGQWYPQGHFQAQTGQCQPSGGASKQAECSPQGSVDSPSTITPLPCRKAPSRSCSSLQTLSSQPPQAASCTRAELQPPLLWLTNLYSHACFYFLEVCQAGAHCYSPVPLVHPSGLLGMVLSCHFQGG